MRPYLLFITCVLPSLATANDSVPLPGQSVPLLFSGATIHTVSGGDLPGGRLLVEKGTITAVVTENDALVLPDGTVTIDVAGKHLYPAMIAANSVLGISEIQSVSAMNDTGETGDINPGARAESSVNPDSELLPVTRANGVLFTLTAPRSGLISGSSALLRLDGWTPKDMTLKAPAAMHLQWPELVVLGEWTEPDDEQALKKLEENYTKKTKALEEAFDMARAYAKARQADPTTRYDTSWEAMTPVLEGRLPVFIHAQTVAQIRDALAFCSRQEIAKPVIVGALDAWRITEELKQHEASVILSEVNTLPLRRWEAADAPYAAAAKLHAAGIPFCIANSGTPFDAPNERNLPYQAARAAAHGLPVDVALKSVTLYPAQILGVSDRLGSLAPGKEGTFLITNGNPLEIRTTIEQVYVLGRKIDLSNKQSRLHEKYLEKYRQLDDPR
jgi:imidazolonepropionase-like amidohydrolase